MLLCSNLLVFREIKMKDPTNSAFTMNVVVILKNTKTQLFSCRYEEGKCVIYNILGPVTIKDMQTPPQKWWQLYERCGMC